MNQTFLAVIALGLTGLVGLSFARARTDELTAADRDQVERMAAAAGLDVLERVGALPFDNATRNATVTDRALLTAAPFPTGSTLALAADVDDVHGMRPLAYASERGLTFTVDASVRYVDEANPSAAAAGRSFAKEVTVTVRGAGLAAPVVLSQVFTYP